MEEMSIYEWSEANPVSDTMTYKKSADRQIGFLLDLEDLLSAGSSTRGCKVAKVISSHRSKSITLPVVEMRRPDLGLRIVVRGNFHDWKLTVLSERPIEADFSYLFHISPPPDPDFTGDCLSPVYFEGFPKDLIRRYYSQSKTEWSASIGSGYDLWVVVSLILRSLGAREDLKYPVRKSCAGFYA